MNYKVLKTKSRKFVRAHHAYCWGALEFSMLCAAGYALFGLILLSTAALAANNTLTMMLEFMVAPVYAAILFASLTGALFVILTLPYAIALGLHLPRRPIPVVATIDETEAPKKRRKAAARPRRTAKA